MADGSVSFLAPDPSFLAEGSPPTAPLVLEPLCEGDEFVHGWYAGRAASPTIAVYLDGVKVGVCAPDLGASAKNVAYPDGVTRPSWPWTLDLFLLDPPLALGRRQRAAARAFVGPAFSAMSPEVIAKTQYFRKNLLQSLPETFSASDPVSDVPMGTLGAYAGPTDERLELDAEPDLVPALPFTAYIGTEAVYVREVDGTRLLVERGRDGTDPLPHGAGEVLVRRVGPLSGTVRALAITLDEMKDWTDSFLEVFDADRCDPKYLPFLAAALGTPLNAAAPVDLQRRTVKTAVHWYKVKGTAESFRMVFYSLGYRMRIYELWTTTGYPEYPEDSPPIDIQTIAVPPFSPPGSWRNNYQFFTETLPGYPAGTPSDAVPQDDPLLIENGGRWYKSPHFAIELASLTQTNLTPEAMRYILATVHRIRPAHTVLDYIRYILTMVDFWPTPIDEYYNHADLLLYDKGWYLGYCDPDDPVFFRSGINFPGGVFPTRNGADALAINMKRMQVVGYCHPPEIFEIIPTPDMTEEYYVELKRDGMGLVPPSGDPGVPGVDYDEHAWPSRSDWMPWSGEVFDRSGKVRYLNTLLITLTP